MAITMIGLDTAKMVFQVHGIDEGGRAALKHQLRRSELIPFFEQQRDVVDGAEQQPAHEAPEPPIHRRSCRDPGW